MKPASEFASANVDQGSLEFISRSFNIDSPGVPGSMLSFCRFRALFLIEELRLAEACIESLEGPRIGV